MFAAIALGVGVDFAIHLVERLRTATEEYGGDLGMAIDRALPPVARACFFNSAALGLGFSVLLVSDLPTLMRFGGLVALASLSSYVAALVIVPALFAAERAWFGESPGIGHASRVPISLVVIAAVILGLFSSDALASSSEANSIAQAVAARKEGAATRRVIDMTLTNRKGRSESRVAVIHKQSSDTLRKTRITFVEPGKFRGMTFLSHDPLAPGAADGRWMYLPAAKRVRSIPTTRRGGAFFGTDFSYEDMQSELKFKMEDWQFELHGEVTVDERSYYRLSGTAKSPRTSREIGYGGFTALIDQESWMPVVVEFQDPKQRPLKTIEVLAIDLISGIWTPGRIVATNHQTGHRTEFQFRDTEYHAALDERLFDSRTLGRSLLSLDEE